MFSLFKKVISFLIVFAMVALILNFKIADRPARDWAMQAWESPQLQSIYQTVKDRVLALIHKDISVEDVFKTRPKADETKSKTLNSKPEKPSDSKPVKLEKTPSGSTEEAKASGASQASSATSTPSPKTKADTPKKENPLVELERLDEKDRKALEAIVKKNK